MDIQNLAALGTNLKRGALALTQGPRSFVPAAGTQVLAGSAGHLYLNRQQASELLQVSSRALDRAAPGVTFERAIGGGRARFARVEAVASAARGAGKVAPERIAQVERLMVEQAAGNLSTRDARAAVNEGVFAQLTRAGSAPLPYLRTSKPGAPLAVTQVVPIKRLDSPSRYESFATGARSQLGELTAGTRRLTNRASVDVGRAVETVRKLGPRPRDAAGGEAPGAQPWYRKHSGKLAIGAGAGVIAGGRSLMGSGGTGN